MTRDIRATRDRLGLSTVELAILVGVTTRTAYRWIEGTRTVPETVWKLLEIYEQMDFSKPQPPLRDPAEFYTVHIGEPSDADKKERKSPMVTVFLHPDRLKPQ